ncbi:YigZ family protein [Sphingobacterium sp. SGG-5]|uniref:YigZ family protein n=1 Tax=Sphingobacterium sp. SGG-5 TaxID=2710881 RepID=UPI0013ED3D39|nr:YigZ family protein [Sphingobacterium sp. SGG-5]NGM61364.1 YigZ family protein [Sphingobacterium sp. SGG-5]
MSLFEDTYLTVEKPSEGVFRDKGSKFIAYAYPFKGEAGLKDIVANVKSQHPKARHHCWAYRLTTDRSVFRINDDGEPSGTAGRPILNVLLSKDVTNILVVVVRYFGGTLLGVPGLIHAYKTATQEALDSAAIVEKTVNDIYRVDFDYVQMNDVMRLVKEENLSIVKQQFDNTCVIEFAVRQQYVEAILKKMRQIENADIRYLYTL